MGRKRKQRRDEAAKPANPPGRRWPFLIVTLITVAGVLAVGLGIAANARQKPVVEQGACPNPAPAQAARQFHSLDDLLKMTPADLAKVDLAEMNLLCATGLPGAENLNLDRCLTRLDEWAQRVRYWTDKSMWDFRQHPQNFRNSEAKFRVLLLISVLQQDFGVHYNDRGQQSCDFSNSKNAFLHGMIDDPNGGTCASMPVMYVAVGRRLDYPMKLVLAKTHVFARWQDPTTGETLNVEGTNAQFADHPDSYYRSWPYPITDAELKQGWYLKPLTPAEELAIFLHNRGYCLIDSGRLAEANSVFTDSCRLAPQDPLGADRVASATNGGKPGRGNPMRPGVPIGTLLGQPARPQADPLAEIERINDINRANIEARMRPPRPVVPETPQPSQGYSPSSPNRPWQSTSAGQAQMWPR